MAEEIGSPVPQPGARWPSARGDVRTDNLTTLAAGTRIGKYEIAAVLGQGGFGITYRGIDTQLDREVAIKEYLPTSFAVRQPDATVLPRSTQLAEDFRWGRDRFLAEARTLARLEHAAGVVNVHDFLEANGTAYMVMGLVRGETLDARLRRERNLAQPQIERLLYPLLDGLEKVHAAGFLHRDIKPANILISDDGQPTLIDFGSSRVALQGRTQAMTAVYTPGYAAFEQFTSARQGPWTDIYALGATLYYCITGAPPPSASDRMIEDRLVPASVAGSGRYAPGLLAAIDAALNLRAGERPQTIAAWRHMLAGASRPMTTAPAGLATRRVDAPAVTPVPVREGTRARWVIGSLAGFVVMGLLAGGIYLWQRQPDPSEKVDGVAEADRRADDEARRRAEETTRREAEKARADAEASQPTSWRMPTSDTLTSVSGRSMQKFAEDLKVATGGKLVITVHAGGTLVPRSAVKEAVQQGSAEIGEIRISMLAGKDPLYGLDAVPFLATSFADARKLWVAQKPLLERTLASEGMMALFVVPGPPNGLFAKKEVNGLSDVRGMRTYVVDEGTFRFATLAGAYPFRLSDAELWPALERGVVDAFILNGVTGAGIGAWQRATHYVDAQMSLPKHLVLVNKATFDKLDQATRNRILDQAAKAESASWIESEGRTRSSLETLARNGVRVTAPSPRLAAEFTDLGRRLLDEWLATAGSDGRSIVDAYRRM